jgi:hypothetical protein
MGFASLQHIVDRRFTFRGLCLPATFHLQGLVTLVVAYTRRIPSRLFFTPAALLGFTLRSFLLPGGIPMHYHREKPTYCFSC